MPPLSTSNTVTLQISTSKSKIHPNFGKLGLAKSKFSRIASGHTWTRAKGNHRLGGLRFDEHAKYTKEVALIQVLREYVTAWMWGWRCCYRGGWGAVGGAARGGGELDGRAGELVVLVVAAAPGVPAPSAHDAREALRCGARGAVPGGGGGPRAPAADGRGGPGPAERPGPRVAVHRRRRRGPARRRLRAAGAVAVLLRVHAPPPVPRARRPRRRAIHRTGSERERGRDFSVRKKNCVARDLIGEVTGNGSWFVRPRTPKAGRAFWLRAVTVSNGTGIFCGVVCRVAAPPWG